MHRDEYMHVCLHAEIFLADFGKLESDSEQATCTGLQTLVLASVDRLARVQTRLSGPDIAG